MQVNMNTTSLLPCLRHLQSTMSVCKYGIMKYKYRYRCIYRRDIMNNTKQHVRSFCVGHSYEDGFDIEIWIS